MNRDLSKTLLEIVLVDESGKQSERGKTGKELSERPSGVERRFVRAHY